MSAAGLAFDEVAAFKGPQLGPPLPASKISLKPSGPSSDGTDSFLSQRRSLAMLGSLCVHVLLLLLLGEFMRASTLPPPRRSIQATLISSSVQQGAEAVSASAPAQPAPAAPVEKPAPKPVVKTRPLEKPATKAVPATPPAPAKPNAAQGAQASSPTNKDQAGPDSSEDADGLLQRLRANWLAPPHAAPVFRCRLRIDYRAGGMISAVTVQQGCGDRSLGDSIERAVWKTQPLPLPPGAPASGNIELEFSP
jgi:outer membrane biosynthesis protein TonB